MATAGLLAGGVAGALVTGAAGAGFVAGASGATCAGCGLLRSGQAKAESSEVVGKASIWLVRFERSCSEGSGSVAFLGVACKVLRSLSAGEIPSITPAACSGCCGVATGGVVAGAVVCVVGVEGLAAVAILPNVVALLLILPGSGIGICPVGSAGCIAR